MVTLLAVCALGLAPVTPHEGRIYETTCAVNIVHDIEREYWYMTHRDLRPLRRMSLVFNSDELQDEVRRRLGNNALKFEIRQPLTVTVRVRSHREGSRITRTYMDVFLEEVQRRDIRPNRGRLDIGDPVTDYAPSRHLKD